jgi:hypothetical protein
MRLEVKGKIAMVEYGEKYFKIETIPNESDGGIPIKIQCSESNTPMFRNNTISAWMAIKEEAEKTEDPKNVKGNIWEKWK